MFCNPLLITERVEDAKKKTKQKWNELKKITKKKQAKLWINCSSLIRSGHLVNIFMLI